MLSGRVEEKWVTKQWSEERLFVDWIQEDGNVEWVRVG